MADKINQIEIGSVTYDLQDKKSIFSGTAEEYEATADTIEDGTVVNIIDDFVEGEAFDTYILNKVDELEDKLGSSIKTRHELMNNTEEGKLADALAIKETVERISYAVSENDLKPLATKTDLLDVDFVYFSEKNRTHKFGATDASTLINSPITEGLFRGRWECVYHTYAESGSLILVKLTEFQPVYGRAWYNFYNWTSWTGWRSDAEHSMLDNASTIKANTTAGKVAGALGVKELYQEINNSLGQTREAIKIDNLEFILDSILTSAGITIDDFSVQDAYVYHYGDLTHKISFGLTCNKQIPAGCVIKLIFNDVNFKKSLANWEYHPNTQIGAALQNDSKTINVHYRAAIGAGYTFWPVISYNSIIPVRNVNV